MFEVVDGPLQTGYAPRDVIVDRMVDLLSTIRGYLAAGVIYDEDALGALRLAKIRIAEAGYSRGDTNAIQTEAQGVISAIEMDKFLAEGLYIK